MKSKSYKLKERARFLRLCKVKGKTILDIGVGPLALIAAKDFNCNVTSVDIDKDALQNAKREVIAEKLEDKIKVEKGDATNLSYADNTFDIVISYGALHHVPFKKRKRFIYEAYRVAKEKIIIAEFNKFGFEQRHSQDNYTPVNLKWLEKELNYLGKVEKYLTKKRNIYVCLKK